MHILFSLPTFNIERKRMLLVTIVKSGIRLFPFIVESWEKSISFNGGMHPS
jgi:hypothetical protein